MSEAPALEIKGLTKHYGSATAVHDLNLRIEAGEIFGLLGPNGAGKSTTIHLITGIARMEKGSIQVFGHDVVRDFEWTRRHIGMMHQEVFPDNFFPIGQGLKLHSGYYGYKDDPVWREILIDRLSLRPHIKKKMLELSGGLKRRFMLAKALIHKPKLLILDEPTAGVDVELRLTLWEFIREINKQGTTVLLTTHYLDEAEKMCNRIGIMNHGKLIALDETRNLVRQIEDRELILTLNRPVALSTALTGVGAKKTAAENEVSILLTRDQKVSEVLDVVRKEGLEILDLQMRASNLENVFIKLTDEKRAHHP